MCLISWWWLNQEDDGLMRACYLGWNCLQVPCRILVMMFKAQATQTSRIASLAVYPFVLLDLLHAHRSGEYPLSLVWLKRPKTLYRPFAASTPQNGQGILYQAPSSLTFKEPKTIVSEGISWKLLKCAALLYQMVYLNIWDRCIYGMSFDTYGMSFDTLISIYSDRCIF